jgi:hypothetical protein
MGSHLSRDRSDAATDHDRCDIDLAPLQPLGAAHVVDVGPGPRESRDIFVPRQIAHHQDFLAEVVEHEGAGERLVVGQRGDDIRLVALGRACEVET